MGGRRRRGSVVFVAGIGIAQLTEFLHPASSRARWRRFRVNRTCSSSTTNRPGRQRRMERAGRFPATRLVGAKEEAGTGWTIRCRGRSSPLDEGYDASS